MVLGGVRLEQVGIAAGHSVQPQAFAAGGARGAVGMDGAGAVSDADPGAPVVLAGVAKNPRIDCWFAAIP